MDAILGLELLAQDVYYQNTIEDARFDDDDFVNMEAEKDFQENAIENLWI